MAKRVRFGLVLMLLSVFLFSFPVLAADTGTDVATTCPTITHVVKPGETLYSIARLYNADPHAIALYNNLINWNLIYPGQVLIITCAPSTQPTPVPTPKPSTGGVWYTVKRGDTLNAIARSYGVSVWSIAAANNLWNINLIYPGQVLYIPTGGTVSPTPTPVPGVSDTAWYAEYFNNIGLDGTPVVTRYDNKIDFNWGLGSPDTRINVEQFSARWTRKFYFTAGTYRFQARSDDGVRIYIDGERILNGWVQQPTTNYLVDVYVKAGYHTVKVEYYDIELTADVVVWWDNVTEPGQPTAVPTATPTPNPTPVVTDVDGWYAEYFANQTLTGTPQITKVDPYIGFEWHIGAPLPGMPADHFSVRWTRNAIFDAGTYNFCASVDDGVRIWVDGALVVDSWKANNGLSYCNQKAVTAGMHHVKVEYFEDGGNALIYVWWDWLH